MFDLFRSQAKAVRILLGVLLAMVALSMLVYLIPGAGAPTMDRSDQVIAEIGKDQVTTDQIEAQIRGLIQDNRVRPDMVEIYIPQLIDQAISDRAVAYQAQQLGFKSPIRIWRMSFVPFSSVRYPRTSTAWRWNSRPKRPWRNSRATSG